MDKKFVSLAESVPAEKFTWRPGEGVRSVSEVFLHVAGANYGLPRLVGVQPPASFQPKGWETSTTDRAKIAAALKESFAHLRQAATSLSDADADKPVKLLGAESTTRAALAFMARHMAEHLGQSIAYARIQGVTPPWTEERQRQQSKKSQ